MIVKIILLGRRSFIKFLLYVIISFTDGMKIIRIELLANFLVFLSSRVTNKRTVINFTCIELTCPFR